MIRLRVLPPEEVREYMGRNPNRWFVLVSRSLMERRFAVLEQSYGERSAEGESWTPVEVV